LTPWSVIVSSDGVLLRRWASTVTDETFGGMVRQVLTARGHSIAWLADAIGKDDATVRSYITARRPVPLDIVLAICDALGVYPVPYMAAAGYPPTVGRAALAIAPGATLLVPIVGDVPADPKRAPMHDAAPTIPYLPYSPSARAENLVALRVVGECLSPEVQPDDYVIVDRSLEPVDGRLGVVLVDGAYTLKRVRRVGAGWSLESNVGELVPLEAAEWYGRVVFSGRAHI
jgi:SOS-response transcriptional repressor LexA